MVKKRLWVLSLILAFVISASTPVSADEGEVGRPHKIAETEQGSQ